MKQSRNQKVNALTKLGKTALSALLLFGALSLASDAAQAQDELGAGATTATSPAPTLGNSPSTLEPETAAPQKPPVSATNPPSLKSTVSPIDQDRQEFEIDGYDPKRQKTILIYLGTEQQETLPYLPTNAKFKGDFRKIVKVSVDRGSNVLRLQALKTGTATLAIHDAKDRKVYEFKIDVSRNTLGKVANEVRSLLSDIEGITIKIINDKVVVDGQVLLPRDMNRIISVVNQYGDKIASSLVTLSPVAQRKIAQAISNDINNPEISVRAVNDKFILEGSANTPEEIERAKQIAEMYVPDIVKEAGEKDGTIVKLKKTFVLNLIQLKPAPPRDPGKIIQLVVHFVELNKNAQKAFKFQFAPTISDQSAVQFNQTSQQSTGVISQLTGTVSNLLPKLNWAKQYGHARVLQSSSMIVLAGQKGDIKNITKVPYQTVNQYGQPSTSFEDAGLMSSITPDLISPRSDSIRLSMDFSMKSLLGITDKGPMISQSSLNTVIIVKSGQSAAVGGLISNSTSTDYNKLPRNVANADPLITLYASKDFQRNQSQFVVFITPIIKASASQGSERIKEKFNLRDN